MMDILSDIVAHKRLELAHMRRLVSEELLKERVQALPPSVRSMRQALSASASGIIAEFKRKSPSKGWIRQEADAEHIPAAYAGAGAAALSILTDQLYFGGSLEDLRRARPWVDIPILRKDFVVDEYQLLQAKEAGADAVLLIAACLSPEECQRLATAAHTWGLEVLLEIHDRSELRYVAPYIDMVGVNNRHLGSFVTDVRTSFEIVEALKQRMEELFGGVSGSSSQPVWVSESGISGSATIRALRTHGFRGFLIGETLMRSGDPAGALKAMIEEVES